MSRIAGGGRTRKAVAAASRHGNSHRQNSLHRRGGGPEPDTLRRPSPGRAILAEERLDIRIAARRLPGERDTATESAALVNAHPPRNDMATAVSPQALRAFLEAEHHPPLIVDFEAPA